MAVWLRPPVHRRALLVLLASLLALAALRAEEPKSPKAAADTGKAGNHSLDPAKLPPNAVIIISDNPREALQNIEAVVVSTEEYRRLLDAAEQAKRLSAPDKPEPPSVCRLSGRVEARGAQEVAVLQAQYQFRTTAPRSLVLLGLQKAKPTAATIDDGRLAVLVPLKDEDAFAVRVEAAGEHRVTVDFETPLISRGTKGGERGLEVGLPGAAITTVERLELPAGVTRVRLNGRTLPARQLAPAAGAPPAAVIGPTPPKLELAWDAPSSAAPAEAMLSAEGRYEVRIDDRAITTRARLTLKVLSGVAREWRIVAPPEAEVTTEGGMGAELLVNVQRPKDPKQPAWVLQRSPSAEDLTVEIYLKSDVTPGRPVAVPVFPVLGASQQRGTLTVSAPPHLRLTFRPSADLSRRESPDEAGHDAVFTYYRLPEAGTPLEVEVQPARGEVETQVVHQLTLTERGWRWQGRFDVRPVRKDVMTLDLEVPMELQELRPVSAEVVDSLTALRDAAPGRRLVRLQLAESRRRAFTFTLEGLYPLNGASAAASLPLPRPVGTLDRGGQVLATAPAGLELRGSYREWENGRAGDWERPLDAAPRGAPGLSTTVERSPARLDLSWRSPRGELPVVATADIQLEERQATVRHHWRIPVGPGSPRQLLVRGPAALAGRLRAIDGGQLTPAKPGEWSVQLTAPSGRDSSLTLAYSFPLPAGPDRPPAAVPLVWLEPCPRCETDVRVWAGFTPDGVLRPSLADGPWTEMPPQAAPDHASLPALSLHGSGTGLPLSLRLHESATGPGTSLVVERVWVQALVDADGQQAYHTRCLLRPQHTHYLEVGLPASASAIQLTALLDGKRLPWRADEASPGARTVRLRIDPPAENATYRLLELLYVLGPGGAGAPPATGRGSRWQLTLTPPRLLGPVFVGPWRWQIGLATGDLLFSTGEDADFDLRWGWQRGLLTPQPAWTGAALQRWFAGDARPTGLDNALPDVAGTTLVGWQASPEALRFLAVPRPLALLVGSLAVVALALAAARWAGPRLLVAGSLALGAAIVWAGLSHPQVLAQIFYVAQPGLAVVAVVLAAGLLVRGRYRRQVLFLPGFTRPPASGSSLFRNGSSARGRREPTTIDAPANL